MAALFARFIPNAAIEVLTWAVLVATRPARPAAIGAAAPRRRGAALLRAAARVRRAQRVHDRRCRSNRRDAMAAGARIAGPAVYHRGRDVHLRLGELRCAYRRRRLHRHGPQGRLTGERDMPDGIARADARRGSSLIDLQIMWKPADRRGGGAGPGADPHRLQPHRARMRRHIRRRVRPARPHVGAGGDRNARAHQLDGGIGEAFHPRLSDRDDEGRRYLYLQRPLARHGASERLRRHHAVFLRGRIVALFSCTSHLVDIGGINGPDARDVFMEGLYIPC